MTVITNASGQFGITQFVVSKTIGRGTHLTIGEAITAASASGGGAIHIYPDNYLENLSIPNLPQGISFEGAQAPSTQSPPVIITGNHTFNAGGYATFKNLLLSADSGDTFTLSCGSADGVADFDSCEITNTAGILMLIDSTGNTKVSLRNCRIEASGTAGISVSGLADLELDGSYLADNSLEASFSLVSVSGGSSVETTQSKFFVSGVGYNCINIGGGSLVTSTLNMYQGPGYAFRFTGNGLARTVSDYFRIGVGAVPTDYYILADGAYGSVRETYASFYPTGTAQTIDPQVTKVYVPTAPIPTPISDGQIIIGKTGDYPQLSTLTAGAGVSITNGAGSITISSIPVSPTWNVIAASQTMAVNSGYIVASGDLVLTLPAISAVGDLIDIVLDNGSSWQIAQNAGQRIRLGSSLTLLGTGGSLASTASGDAISLVCTQANTMWCTVAVQGNITIT